MCVSSISLNKLDPDKLTIPFKSAHQFTLVCKVSDSKTVRPGCHYNSCSKAQFCSHSPPLLYTDLCLVQQLTVVRHVFLRLVIGVRHLPPPSSSSVSASYLPVIIQTST